MKYFSALAALSLLTMPPDTKPIKNDISWDIKQPMEVPKGYQHQPKPLSKKQKTKRRK